MPVAKSVIAVASGKGGVGKSTVALNVGVALSTAGLRVGLLDADLYGPDLPAMVGLTRRKHAGSVAVWSDPKSTRREKPVERFGVHLMSTQFLLGEDQALALSMPMAELLIARMRDGIAWGDLDLLVVDLPPGTADLQQLVARHLGLAGVLMVVTPQDVAHLDAKKAIAMYRSAQVPIIGGVENMAGLECPSCGDHVTVFPEVQHDRSIWAAGVERLVSIPLQPAVGAAAEAGVPIVVADPHGAVAAAFAHLAATISARLALT